MTAKNNRHSGKGLHELEIPIKGMQCRSCEAHITANLEALPNVKKVQVSIRTKSATITAKQLPTSEAIASAVQAAGYSVGRDTLPFLSRDLRVYRDMALGLAIVLLLFILFTRLGLGNVAQVSTDSASAGVVALTVGLTAGFSTCMALIGGLVLGISSRYAGRHPEATSGQKFRPHMYFNLGRITSFLVLGGLIGALGAIFQLKGNLLGLLTAAVGIVMLLLGLQLTGLFPQLKGTVALPRSLGKRLGIGSRQQPGGEYSHWGSFWLGSLTFFLPCGFTQAVQLFAISTASWTTGALVMGMFAIGTTPGLLSIGGLTSAVKGGFAKRFFRVAGVIVVAMAVVNLSNSYTLLGVNRVFSRATPPAGQTGQNLPPATLNTTYTLESDIVPSTFKAKVGQKTTLVVDVKDNGEGCMSTIMVLGLDNNPQFLEGGKKLSLTFTPQKPGTYQIACAMGVPRGTIQVEA
ncbi:MAG TPA: sulfite exporter TauE/SafE family protein [Candidatus Saccharimonadales bacterium]|nr:sulfite exporter TauE/SafE family protein [Candidatus Saccharimonadales bacterium]